MREESTERPLARSEKIIIKELPDEVLVYDLARDKAHCLNLSAAAVWKCCDGRTTPGQIATKLRKKLDPTIDERFVWLALDQLGRDDLLQKRFARPAGIRGMSRREAVRRIGLGAAIALPIVVSITAPSPAQAATCKVRGATCATDVECCSGNCRGNNTCA